MSCIVTTLPCLSLLCKLKKSFFEFVDSDISASTSTCKIDLMFIHPCYCNSMLLHAYVYAYTYVLYMCMQLSQYKGYDVIYDVI